MNNLTVRDIVIEGERIYGDGVNIAARLGSLADVGGLCVSGTVYDQIENKLPLTHTYLGAQTVKNIKQPVRVYRVETELQPFAPTVHASGIEESDTSATPLRLVRQKGQHAGVPPSPAAGTDDGFFGSSVSAGAEPWRSSRLGLPYLPSSLGPKHSRHAR